MNGRFRPPLYFLGASLLVYFALLSLRLNGIDSPWIDRVILGVIVTTAGFTVYALPKSTEVWSLRGLGIWGFMLAIVLSYIASQLVVWGLIGLPLPFYVSNIWRSMLAVSGTLMLYGYLRWTQRRALDEPKEGSHADIP